MLQKPHTHSHTYYKACLNKHSTKNYIKYKHYNQVPSVNGQHNTHVNFVPKNFIVAHFRSLNIKTKSLHIYLMISPKSLLFTSLHLYTLNPHLNSLDCNYILNPLSNSVYFIGERRQ